MKERPILFTGEMVRAILDDRKTKTRRVVKPQPPVASRLEGYGAEFSIAGHDYRCPYGEPGDLLYVRETWCPVDDREFGGDLWTDYRATPRYGHDEPAGWGPEDRAADPDSAGRWRPSIHMPKNRARLWLRVTDVRVERVQEISAVDMRAEGVTCGLDYPGMTHCTAMPCNSLRSRWVKLWDSINAKRGYGWDTNPWVWVVTFERIDR